MQARSAIGTSRRGRRTTKSSYRRPHQRVVDLERRPWASAPFSRTTAAGPRRTVSGCGCVPARAARSSRGVAVRAAPRSRP